MSDDYGVTMPKNAMLSLQALIHELEDGSILLESSVKGRVVRGHGATYADAYFALKQAIWEVVGR